MSRNGSADPLVQWNEMRALEERERGRVMRGWATLMIIGVIGAGSVVPATVLWIPAGIALLVIGLLAFGFAGWRVREKGWVFGRSRRLFSLISAMAAGACLLVNSFALILLMGESDWVRARITDQMGAAEDPPPATPARNDEPARRTSAPSSTGSQGGE